MWIKVCANTSLSDARLAADLGADALGFVFAKSSRQVTSAAVAAITPHLPAEVERIGVFDIPDAAEIARTVQEAGLTGVQLHGAFSEDLLSELQQVVGDGTTIIPVLHWDLSSPAASPLAVLDRQLGILDRHPFVRRILVDSRVAGASGGTGVPFDWKAATDLLRMRLGHRHLIVAGGLNAGNVSEAIARLTPWGVDVATGVESSPGRKDPKKLEAFLRKASLRISLPA